jgi:ASC-1-like (ASCH) protein
MQIGDIWNFTHNSLPITSAPKYSTKIIDKKIYNSFEDAINDTGFKALLPNATSNEEAVKIYNAFGDGAYEREAKHYGVVRFTLQFIISN